MPVRRFVLVATMVGSICWLPVLLAQEGEPADSVETHSGSGPTPEGAARRSILWTVLPSATVILAPVALVAGPATGYFYGGMPGRAWLGIAIRTAGLGAMIGAFGVCGWNCGPGDSGYNAAWAMFIGGSAVLLGSAIYDMATVSRAVRRRWSAQAFVLPSPSPGSTVRFGINVQF